MAEKLSFDCEYFDENGCLTDDVLEAIKNFDCLPDGRGDIGEVERLTEFVQSLWYYNDSFVKREDGLWEVHTRNWSDNNLLIDALRANLVYWGLYFCREDKFGHYLLGNMSDWRKFCDKEREIKK